MDESSRLNPWETVRFYAQDPGDLPVITELQMHKWLNDHNHGDRTTRINGDDPEPLLCQCTGCMALRVLWHYTYGMPWPEFPMVKKAKTPMLVSSVD